MKLIAEAPTSHLDMMVIAAFMLGHVSTSFRPASAVIRMDVRAISMSAKPKISYFSICGRGMMSRLVATAGEVDFEENVWDPSFDETGGWRQGYAAIGNALGFPGVMPILEHGDFKLFQSVAIEGYLASLSPKFSALTPAQKGTDLMFQEIRSDINAATESLLFKKIEAEALPPIMEKSYAMVEGLLPESGFINGLDFPTPADLAVLVITKGCMPFRAAPHLAGCTPTPDKYPKMFRIANAAAAYEPVAKYLEETTVLKADPFGLMPPQYATE